MAIVQVRNPKGLVSIDTSLLRDALMRWQGVCLLSAKLVAEMEDCKYDIAKSFDTTELLHHAMSDYTVEVQRELMELINDLAA